MQKECRTIVEKAIPKRQSLWERIKEIYWGPGIRAIFYQSGSIWLIVALFGGSLFPFFLALLCLLFAAQFLDALFLALDVGPRP